MFKKSFISIPSFFCIVIIAGDNITVSPDIQQAPKPEVIIQELVTPKAPVIAQKPVAQPIPKQTNSPEESAKKNSCPVKKVSPAPKKIDAPKTPQPKKQAAPRAPQKKQGPPHHRSKPRVPEKKPAVGITESEAPCSGPARTITVKNCLTKAEITYKHWSGKHTPIFKLFVHGKEMNMDQQSTVEIKNNKLLVQYDFDFARGYYKDSRKVELTVPQGSSFDLHFSWKDQPNLSIHKIQ